jgi:hypothetical protein
MTLWMYAPGNKGVARSYSIEVSENASGAWVQWSPIETADKHSRPTQSRLKYQIEKRSRFNPNRATTPPPNTSNSEVW